MKDLVIIFEGEAHVVAEAKRRLDAEDIPALETGGQDWELGFALQVPADREADARRVLEGFTPTSKGPDLKPEEYRRRQRLLLIYLGIALACFAAFWWWASKMMTYQ